MRLGSLTMKKLIGIRDPLGIRPLVLGKLGDATILASETCALDIIGARFLQRGREWRDRRHLGGRDREPQALPALPSASLHFRIYLFRPPRFHHGRALRLRRAQGAWPRACARSARQCGCGDSGPRLGRARPRSAMRPNPACRSSLASSATTMSGRTFIEPEQRIRKLGVKLKHNPTPSL